MTCPHQDPPVIDQGTLPINPAHTTHTTAVPTTGSEAEADSPFTVMDVPAMHSHQSHCAWDLLKLSICICGHKASTEVTGIIQCHKASCETVWVSETPKTLVQ